MDEDTVKVVVASAVVVLLLAAIVIAFISAVTGTSNETILTITPNRISFGVDSITTESTTTITDTEREDDNVGVGDWVLAIALMVAISLGGWAFLIKECPTN